LNTTMSGCWHVPAAIHAKEYRSLHDWFHLCW
jgi:hypothetical protein